MTQDTALKILQTGANVFLTGEPGSGKTHTLNRYAGWLREHGIEPAVTASTGIAATHIGGMTIHSWSGIGVRKDLSNYDLDSIASNERVVKRISRANVLIIDEASMLSADTLAMAERVCRHVRGKDAPFGGLQVVLVGDFFQLPPIVPRKAAASARLGFDTDEEGALAPFAFCSRAWEGLNPLVCYLSEQHRQDDAPFRALLASVRSGRIDKRAYEMLTLRRTNEKSAPPNLPRLYTHNADVDRVNDDRLAVIAGKARHFEMTSRGPERLVAGLMRGCLSPEDLALKVGARVMFTKNNPDGSFVNGTLGEVESFEKGGTPLVRTFAGRRISVEPMEWIIADGTRILARITQLPLRLAWAITVHKSQGLTLDGAVMDLSQAFEYGQGYVALSRVRSLSGLHLLGVNERALAVHPEISAQDRNFKLSSAGARKAFEAMPEKEHAKLARNFIVASGGKPEGGLRASAPKSAPRIPTIEVTLALLKNGSSLAKIAKERSLAESTVLGHVLKLYALERITRDDVAPLVSERLTSALPIIHAAFKKLGAERLTPVFEKLQGNYSYDDLRLARILFEH